MNGATWDNKCIERFKKKRGNKNRKKISIMMGGGWLHTHTHIIKKFQGILHVYIHYYYYFNYCYFLLVNFELNAWIKLKRGREKKVKITSNNRSPLFCFVLRWVLWRDDFFVNFFFFVHNKKKKTSNEKYIKLNWFVPPILDLSLSLP